MAYSKVRVAARRLGGIVYKKLDSTLRGNVGQELEAVMDELHLTKALVSPALPSSVRTTVDGRLMVGGLPLRRTRFVDDPLCPWTDHVPTLLRSQCRRRIGHIGVDTVDQGVECLLAEVCRRPEEVFVVDAVSDQHLGVIAGAAARLFKDCVSCGSAGLAQALPIAFGWTSASSPSCRVGGMGLPVLAVAGSRCEAAVRQIQEVLSRGKAVLVEIDPLDMDTTAVQGLLAASQSLRQGTNVLLTPAFKKHVPTLRDSVARRLGELAAEATASLPISGLVLTGGAVAFSVCSALGIVAIEIEAQLAPGVPCGRVPGGRWNGLRLVTKAGGFGEKDILVRGIDYLRGEDRRE